MTVAAPTGVDEPGSVEPSGTRTVWHWVLLALILAIALGARLWSIDHGLPWIYNPDLAANFVTISFEFKFDVVFKH
jgi:hypothetical protein